MRRVVCVEIFIFGGSLLGRIQGGRQPVSLFYIFVGIIMINFFHYIPVIDINVILFYHYCCRCYYYRS